MTQYIGEYGEEQAGAQDALPCYRACNFESVRIKRLKIYIF